MRRPYRLSPSEVEIFKLGAEDPNIITDYWFRAPGVDVGWIFDYNFTKEGAWQKTVHHASQRNIVVIGGFGSGKTTGVAMSASTWAMTTPSFKFLNIAPTHFQSRLMYNFIMGMAQNSRFEKLIWKHPQRPYAQIVLRFYIGERLVESSMEFMSADKDATNILSWEGDWINIEEGGLLDDLPQIVSNLGSRLRGSVRGRARLGRLSLISNSWDNPYMWEMFDRASSDPDRYLSITVSSRANKNITASQLIDLIDRVPEDERDQFIDGLRPVGKGKYFSKPAIYQCEDLATSEQIETAVKDDVLGYYYQELLTIGVTEFYTPYDSNYVYVVIGDPGISDAPYRDSPAIMVWKVPLEFPLRACSLVAMWWGSPHGAITPFVNKLLEWREKYHAAVTAVDSTGPQRNMAEIINIQYLGLDEWADIESDFPTLGILGMDFSGAKKSGYLVVLRMFIEAALMQWPKFITGIRSQLANYDPAKDKKIAQDLVATMAMSAFLIRGWFDVDLSEVQGNKPMVVLSAEDVLFKRKGERGRNQRAAIARSEQAQFAERAT